MSYQRVFVVDAASCTDTNFYVDTPMGTFALILADEGLVCDIYPLQVSDGPVASCYATINDLEV